MAFVNDATLDAALANIADTGDTLHLCNAEPTTYTQASSTFSVGSVALTEGDGNGDYTIANGDVDGRKLTLGAQTVSTTANDTATHYAIVDAVGSVLILQNTMTNVAVTSGGTQDTQAVDVLEIGDLA